MGARVCGRAVARIRAAVGVHVEARRRGAHLADARHVGEQQHLAERVAVGCNVGVIDGNLHVRAQRAERKHREADILARQHHGVEANVAQRGRGAESCSGAGKRGRAGHAVLPRRVGNGRHGLSGDSVRDAGILCIETKVDAAAPTDIARRKDAQVRHLQLVCVLT